MLTEGLTIMEIEEKMSSMQDRINELEKALEEIESLRAPYKVNPFQFAKSVINEHVRICHRVMPKETWETPEE